MSPEKFTWYKIRMGSFKDRAEAQRALDRLKKYKNKAIIVSNKTTRPAKKKKVSEAEGKKEQQPKTSAPAPRENLSSPEKQEAVGKQEKQTLEVKAGKKSLIAKPAVETPAGTAETDKSLSEKPEVESSGVVKESIEPIETQPIEQEKDKVILASKGEIPSQQDRKDRLESFLHIYCQTYASKDLDKFVTFFTPDATENNAPFQDMLPKYRKNMEKIQSFNYRIELIDYSLQDDTGNISIQGKYFTRYLLHDGSWKENSGSISMELTENGDSYLVKRLSYP